MLHFCFSCATVILHTRLFMNQNFANIAEDKNNANVLA